MTLPAANLLAVGTEEDAGQPALDISAVDECAVGVGLCLEDHPGSALPLVGAGGVEVDDKDEAGLVAVQPTDAVDLGGGLDATRAVRMGEVHQGGAAVRLDQGFGGDEMPTQGEDGEAEQEEAHDSGLGGVDVQGLGGEGELNALRSEGLVEGKVDRVLGGEEAGGFGVLDLVDQLEV